MNRVFDPDRKVGRESRKAYAARCESGFWDRWLRDPPVLDLGYRGGLADALPIVAAAIGFEIGTPGYDGRRLPFRDGTVGTVFNSHLLEHLKDPIWHLREWFRVLRVGGTLVLMVPHAFLYERRLTVPPSRFSGEHLRSYTPAMLLAEIERALIPNTYRVRHLADVDIGYDYGLLSEIHPTGCFEIELVIERIVPPAWSVET